MRKYQFMFKSFFKIEAQMVLCSLFFYNEEHKVSKDNKIISEIISFFS